VAGLHPPHHIAGTAGDGQSSENTGRTAAAARSWPAAVLQGAGGKVRTRHGSERVKRNRAWLCPVRAGGLHPPPRTGGTATDGHGGNDAAAARSWPAAVLQGAGAKVTTRLGSERAKRNRAWLCPMRAGGLHPPPRTGGTATDGHGGSDARHLQAAALGELTPRLHGTNNEGEAGGQSPKTTLRNALRGNGALENAAVGPKVAQLPKDNQHTT
jgi:hypothetical protein